MTRMLSIKIVLTIIVVIFALMLTGCQSSPIQDLQLALDAISTALPVIAQLTSIPPGVLASVETYLNDANTALGQSASVLSGPGTDAQKAAQIVSIFAKVTAPDVPPQYQSLVNLVSQIAARVVTFLGNFASTSVKPKTFGSQPAKTTVLSADQLSKLDHAKATAEKNSVALKALKK